MKKLKLHWLIYIGAFVLLSIVFGIYHQKVWISSDTTTTLPLAIDWLQGNIFLKGWVMGSNNFFLTEIVIYAIGKVFGFSNLTLLYFIPGIAWSLLFLGTVAYMSDEIKNNRDRIMFCIITGCIVMIVAPWAAYTLLNANSHNNLYAFLIIYLLILNLYIKKDKIFYLIIATFLAGFLLFSEGVTTMVLIVPIACMCIVQILKKNKIFYKILLSVAVSYIMGKLIFLIFHLMGGMETVGIPLGITHPNELISRCISWINQFATFFGLGNFYESAWGIKKVYATVLMILFVAAIIYYAVQFWKLSWKKQSLLFIVCINIAACIFTKVACTYRYVVVGYYFGFVFVALFVIEMIGRISKKTVRFCTMMFGMVFFSIFACTKISDALHDGKANGDFADMAKIIKENQLGDGYGDYWCASSISFFTDYQNQILPVYIHDDKGLMPYSELIRKDWYDEKDMHYIISYVDESRSTFIDEDIMRQLLGDPNQVYEAGPYILYYYNEDLSNYCVKE